MKRMELHIAITFAIMFVVGVITNGLYSVIFIKCNFFTFEVMANGLIFALEYLVFVWINSRKHKLLAYIGVLGICFVVFSFEGVVASIFSDWNWKDTVYYLIAFQIANYQCKELLN